MACTILMPERVSRLGLVSSIAPFVIPGAMDGMNEQSRALYSLALADPVAFSAQIEALATSGEVVYQIMTAGLPPEDKSLFEEASIREMYLANMAEAVHSGVAGVVSDMLLFPHPWGFEPAQIICETLLWQGLKDINVPPTMARYLAAKIPRCTPCALPSDAHFLLFSHWESIFTELTA